MGIFDERRKQLGISAPQPSNTASTPKLSSGSGSVFERRRQQLQVEKEERRQESIRQADARKKETAKVTAGATKSANTVKSLTSGLDALRSRSTQPAETMKPTPAPSNADAIGRLRNTIGAVDRVIEDQRGQNYSREEIYKSEPPVIRDIHRGLDKLATATKPIADVAMELYTPGAGLSAINAGTKAVGSLLSRVAPRLALGQGVGAKAATKAIEEAVTGVPLAVGNELAKNPQASNRELLESAALGGAGGAALGAAGPIVGKLAQSGATKLTDTAKRILSDRLLEITGAQADAIRRSGTREFPLTLPGPQMKVRGNVNRVETPDVINIPETSPRGLPAPRGWVRVDSPDLDKLVQNKGFESLTPETIAQSYNDKVWYHGTGTDKLNTANLDPFVGNHESLFGQGVYFTDDPTIAKGYANSRGKRGTPTIYESNVNVNRVLDLEKPITPDVSQAILNTAKSLDYHDDGNITSILEDMISRGATPEQVITKLRESVRDLSHDLMIPTSEFVETFQDLAINLKRAGYDGITHSGGHRTGREAHRVLILLDPQNIHGAEVGPRQVTLFEKYSGNIDDLTHTQSGVKGHAAAPDVRVGRNPGVAPSVFDRRREELGIRRNEEPGVPTSDSDTTQEVTDIEPVRKVNQTFFERLFGRQNIGITPFGSSKRLSDTPLTTEDQIVSSPLRNTVQGTKEQVGATARAAYHNLVDSLSPLKKISRETYDASQDAARSNNLANTIIRDKFVDNQGKVIGNSLKDIIGATGRGNGKAFEDYLVSRHAITRLERGERVYDDALKITPENIRERVATLEKRYPGFKQLGEEWDKFNQNILDNAVAEGLITQEARDAMRAANPNYASMRRQFTTSERLAQPKFRGSGSSFSGQSAPIKEYSPTGSTRRIVSPVRSAIEQVQSWKNAELRNRVMQEVVKVVQRDPDGMKGLVEIVKKPSTSFRSLDDALREGGSEEFINQLDNDFRSLFAGAKTGDENIVRAMVKGRPVYLKVHDPEAVKALLGMGQEQSGIVLEAFNILSNATKRGATGILSPFFAVKSVVGDTVQGAIQAENAFKHVAVDVPHAIISSIADVFRIPKLKNLAEEFRRAGGEYSALLRDDRQLKKSVRDLRKESFLSPKGVAKGAEALVKSPFKALEKVADISENANRIAAFRRYLRGKERTPENVRAAINAAREVTVNFSRKGNWSRNIESVVPYQNAAIQGGYRLAKAFAKNPIKTLSGITSLVLLPKFYEYSQFNDDPDYQKLPARERYRNIITNKNEDGTFNKIPMAPEYLAFGSFMTDVLNDVVANDPQAYKGTLSALADALLPPAVGGSLKGLTEGGGIEQSISGAINSTVAAPFVATVGNQSFTGAPIVPQRLQDLPTKFQYDDKTSSVAKFVGDKLGLAPLKVDYLIRAYGGDPARLVLPLLSPVGAGTPKQTLLKNFIVDPVFTNTLSTDYYDAKDAYTKAKNANAQFDEPLPEWYREDIHKLLTSQAKGSASKQLTALNNEKRSIQGDKLYTASQKAQKLREVQAKINDIYVDVNSKLQSSGYQFPNR